jgi:hypothetical protein
MNVSPQNADLRPTRAAIGQLVVAALLSLGGLLFLGALAGKFSNPIEGICSMGPSCTMDGDRMAADCPMMKAKRAASSEPAPPPGFNPSETILHGKCCCDASGSTTANQVQQALLSGHVTTLPPPEPVIVRSARRQIFPRLQFLDRRVSRAPPAFSRA